MKKTRLVYPLGIVIVSILLISPLNADGLKNTDRFSARDLPMGFVELWAISGKIMLLRVSEPIDSWGPKERQIKGEVIVQLNDSSNRAYGFQLRKDERAAANSAMFELLKDAFKNNWTITIDYLMPRLSDAFPNKPDWNVGYIKRVTVQHTAARVPRGRMRNRLDR